MADESAPVREGDVLAGKYRVERVLGVGGMGVVVAAMHLQLDQRVALKFLLPSLLQNPEVVARFAREARAAAKIRGEHVARVVDVGTLDTGSPFMVMEYLEGSDLADVLARGGPLPIEQAVLYILQACEAIAEAHAAGIVHRDLKPGNLFLARRPGGDAIVKVLDFGISKTPAGSSGTGAGLTATAALMGSPLYMSPEQLMSTRSVDARTDIWSLGVILYEMLAGRPPFLGETMPEVIAQVMHVALVPITRLRADVPPGLAAVVARCLEKEPARRCADVAELARALGPFAPAPAAETSIGRIARVLGGAAVASAEPQPRGAMETRFGLTGLRTTRRAASIGLALLVALAAATAVVGYLAWRRAPETAVAPVPATAATAAPAPAVDSPLATPPPPSTPEPRSRKRRAPRVAPVPGAPAPSAPSDTPPKQNPLEMDLK